MKAEEFIEKLENMKLNDSARMNVGTAEIKYTTTRNPRKIP